MIKFPDFAPKPAPAPKAGPFGRIVHPILEIFAFLNRPHDVIVNWVDAIVRERPEQAGKAAWEALKGNKPMGWGEVLKHAGVEAGIGRTVAGVGLDIAVDPTWLLPGVGQLGKAGKAAKYASRLPALPGDIAARYLRMLVGTTAAEKIKVAIHIEDMLPYAAKALGVVEKRAAAVPLSGTIAAQLTHMRANLVGGTEVARWARAAAKIQTGAGAAAEFGETWAKQAALGQRGLFVTPKIPFLSEGGTILVGGKPVLAGASYMAQAVRETPILGDFVKWVGKNLAGIPQGKMSALMRRYIRDTNVLKVIEREIDATGSAQQFLKGAEKKYSEIERLIAAHIGEHPQYLKNPQGALDDVVNQIRAASPESPLKKIAIPDWLGTSKQAAHLEDAATHAAHTRFAADYEAARRMQMGAAVFKPVPIQAAEDLAELKGQVRNMQSLMRQMTNFPAPGLQFAATDIMTEKGAPALAKLAPITKWLDDLESTVKGTNLELLEVPPSFRGDVLSEIGRLRTGTERMKRYIAEQVRYTKLVDRANVKLKTLGLRYVRGDKSVLEEMIGLFRVRGNLANRIRNRFPMYQKQWEKVLGDVGEVGETLRKKVAGFGFETPSPTFPAVVTAPGGAAPKIAVLAKIAELENIVQTGAEHPEQYVSAWLPRVYAPAVKDFYVAWKGGTSGVALPAGGKTLQEAARVWRKEDILSLFSLPVAEAEKKFGVPAGTFLDPDVSTWVGQLFNRAKGAKSGAIISFDVDEAVATHAARWAEKGAQVRSTKSVLALAKAEGRKLGEDVEVHVLAEAGPKIKGLAYVKPGEFTELQRKLAGKGKRAYMVDERVGNLVLMEAGEGHKGIILPIDVADYLNERLAPTPEDIRGVKRVYDTFLNWWKSYTLLPWPAYHIRNLLSDTLNSIMERGWSVKGAKVAGRLMWTARYHPERLSKIHLRLGKWEGNAAELMRTSEQIGIMQKGFMATETAEAGRMATRKTSWIPGTQTFAFLRAGRAVGQLENNFTRLTHQITRMMRGDTMLEARDSVTRALFNYADLTRFEREGLRRLIPFYTWARKNVPYQIEKLLASPGYGAAVYRGTRGLVTSEQRIDERYIPTYVKDAWGIQTSGNGTDAKFRLLGNWLPMADLVKLDSPRSFKDYMINALSPMLKVPIENFMNWNSFFQDRIEKYPGQKEVFLGAQVSPGAAHLLRNIRLLSEADAAVRWWVKRKVGEGGVSPLTRQLGLPTTYIHKGEQARVTYILRLRDLRTALMKDLRQAVLRKQMTRARQLVARIKEVDAALQAEGKLPKPKGLAPKELIAAASA